MINIFYVTITDRVKNQIKAIILKRQSFCHICFYDIDFITLTQRNVAFAFKLSVRIIQNRAMSTKRCKNWHLLTATACKPKQLCTIQAFISQKGRKPFVRNRSCWG